MNGKSFKVTTYDPLQLIDDWDIDNYATSHDCNPEELKTFAEHFGIFDKAIEHQETLNRSEFLADCIEEITEHLNLKTNDLNVLDDPELSKEDLIEDHKELITDIAQIIAGYHDNTY